MHRETEDAIYIISSLNHPLTLYLTPDQSINHTIMVTDTTNKYNFTIKRS